MADEVILMEDMIIRAKNIIISKLAAATGVTIRLSDEQDPEAPAPYGYYSFVTPYVPTGELGSHTQRTLTDPGTGEKYIQDICAEYPEMALSLSFCSANRQTSGGEQINGETEAMNLAMKAAAWLLNKGRAELSLEHDLVVLRIGNCASRSGIVGDEYVRRWGFDMSVRYKAMTVRDDQIAENVRMIQMKEE